jgi:hypothetical protein
MITIEESIHLLTSDLVSGMYLPETYLSIPEIDHSIRTFNWMIRPSELQGWVILQRRVIYQD